MDTGWTYNWLTFLASCYILSAPGIEALPTTCNQQDGTYLDEKCLVQHLMHGYEVRARPVLNSSQPVNVYFGITPIQISDLSILYATFTCLNLNRNKNGQVNFSIASTQDEVNQVLSVNVWLQHIWVDERLKWEPRLYNNLSKLRLPQSAVWLPDIVLYNSAEDYSEVMKTRITVEYTGDVFWGPPTRYRASCQINVKYFPFDVQECSMKFSSWMYDGTQLNLSTLFNKVDLDNYLQNGEWELIDITVQRSSIKYECCPDPYPFVTYKFIIKRRVLYYLFNIVFPCLWLAILSVMTFWLPPDSGEKITLGITVLLAFSVFMLLVAESMPKTSESVPLIGIYLFVTMSLTSFAIVLTIFILQIHHVGPRQRRMPKWLRTFAFEFLARMLCIRSIVHNFLKGVSLEDGIAKFPRPAKIMSTPDLVCTYAMELASQNGNSTLPLNNGSTRARLAHTRNDLDTVITEQLRKNARYKKQKEEQKTIGDEWRLLAIILDRLFFWVYMVVTISASVGILLLMPAAGDWFKTKKTW